MCVKMDVGLKNVRSRGLFLARWLAIHCSWFSNSIIIHDKNTKAISIETERFGCWVEHMNKLTQLRKLERFIPIIHHLDQGARGAMGRCPGRCALLESSLINLNLPVSQPKSLLKTPKSLCGGEWQKLVRSSHLIKKNSERANKHSEFFLIRCKHSQRAANQFLRWLENEAYDSRHFFQFKWRHSCFYRSTETC